MLSNGNTKLVARCIVSSTYSIYRELFATYFEVVAPRSVSPPVAVYHVKTNALLVRRYAHRYLSYRLKLGLWLGHTLPSHIQAHTSPRTYT